MAPAIALSAAAKEKVDPAGAAAAARIPVEVLGYFAPSNTFISYRYSTSSLNFIDSEHLLFTFHESGLMRRIPGDPEGDQDQVIRAVVLEIGSGRTLQQAEWRMHDRQQYLWPLHDGKFVVRQRNTLYLTDSSLELRPYLQFNSALEALGTSPDRSLMLIETQKILAPDTIASAAAPATAAPAAITIAPGMTLLGARPQPQSLPQPQKRTQILLISPVSKVILAVSEARHSMDLPLFGNGFLEVIEGNKSNKWVVQRRNLHTDPKIISEIQSACPPALVTLSNTVALAVGCPTSGSGDHLISAISLAGGLLWKDRWLPRYVWPTFDYAENGSRFAYASLEVNRSVGAMDSFGADDVIGQTVGVFNTETGKVELVKKASPVVSAGHNYALSSDGRRFAILREGAIEVYDLPPATTPAPADPPKK